MQTSRFRSSVVGTMIGKTFTLFPTRCDMNLLPWVKICFVALIILAECKWFAHFFESHHRPFWVRAAKQKELSDGHFIERRRSYSSIYNHVTIPLYLNLNEMPRAWLQRRWYDINSFKVYIFENTVSMPFTRFCPILPSTCFLLSIICPFGK